MFEFCQGRSKSIKNQGGQISVLIILSLIPLFTLFAFAVNIGMLVNAKISLQNAADLAAYSGAATQARQLTSISHLNYKLRQNYKKFLFKYYVMGNISLKCFPRDNMPAQCNLANAGSFDWVNPGQTGYPGVPTTCINLTTESNACQLGTPLPTIKPPNCIPLDPTCGALTNSALAIASLQKESCKGNATINSNLLSHWLYASDAEGSASGNQNIVGLTTDLGLMIESMIDYTRIRTLEKFINQNPQKVTLATLKNLENDTEQARTERTMLAFKSALKNLNEYVFEQDTIEMEELLPKGARGADLLTLQEVQPLIDAGYTVMEDAGADNQCNIAVKKISAKPYVAVYKQDNKLVFYAVKLSAKARLLFNPFPLGNPDSSIELTAYAAASPFGSRIGPKVKETDFVVEKTSKPTNEKFLVPVLPPIDADKGLRWDSVEVLKAFHRALKTSVQQGGSVGVISNGQFNFGLRAALLPEESELGQYNIPANSGELPTFYSENQAVQPGAHSDPPYTFWAPMVPDDGQDEFRENAKQSLDLLATFSTTISTNTPDQTMKNQLKGYFEGKIDGIPSYLRQKGNYNIAKIYDPLSEAFFNANANGQRPQIPGKVSDKSRLLSSYVTNLDFNKYQTGRDGYSVKMISFESLFKKPGIVSNNSGGMIPWQIVTENFGTEKENLIKTEH